MYLFEDGFESPLLNNVKKKLHNIYSGASLIIYIKGKSDEARWFHIGSALYNIHGHLTSFTWAGLRRMLKRMHK